LVGSVEYIFQSVQYVIYVLNFGNVSSTIYTDLMLRRILGKKHSRTRLPNMQIFTNHDLLVGERWGEGEIERELYNTMCQ